MRTHRVGFGAGRWMLCILGCLALAACGGGGSGSGSGSSSSSSGGGSSSATFSVSGNIKGLDASGLVLEDNGGNSLTVPSGASTFTFTTDLASGASYDVTVAQQPTGENCSVSSSTGTVSGNVTSVAVACTVDTYTIGGNIKGLNASGLVLEDNGGDNLTVPSGATTFTFATKLASGATYDVKVASQPSTENCLMTSGGSGTVSGNVTNVTVTCSGSGYTVSGTLTGLSTAGLKLQDYKGGETISVAAGATSFQFTQSVMYGTDVDVTVNTQPFWQTCTAGSSNFTGPITSNLTSDTFSCAPDTANVTTFAGTTTAGHADGTGSAASFDAPSGVAMDSSGNIYVADTLNDEIREITPAGAVTTLAGTAGTTGSVNGNGTVALFSGPTGIAVNSAGDIFVADSGNNEIREIVCTGTTASTCTVSTLAGSTTPGNTNGLGTQALFRFPTEVAVDSSGNLYVADTQNQEIREIVCTASPPTAGTCTVSTLAGTGSPGSTNGVGTSAQFDAPTGVAVDASGHIYVADQSNNEIREIVCTGTTASTCTVSTLAGSTTAGSADGTGSAASFRSPTGIAVDSGGDLYVADSGNDEIRLVTQNGVVTTLAGQAGVTGFTNGTGTSAQFSSPSGVAVDTSGNLFVGDYGNNEIRELMP